MKSLQIIIAIIANVHRITTQFVNLLLSHNILRCKFNSHVVNVETSQLPCVDALAVSVLMTLCSTVSVAVAASSHTDTSTNGKVQ